MGNFFISWKTSLGGIGTILGAVSDIIHSYATGAPVNWNIDIPIIIGGFTLIFAKDANVSNSPTPMAVSKTVPTPAGK
jgi:hypothetical protein